VLVEWFAVCGLLQDEKCENVSLRRLVTLLKQQTQDTRTLLSADAVNIKQFVTSEQSQWLAGDSLTCYD